MKVAEVRKLIGQKVSVQKRYSGITDCGVILSVKGRNIEVDFWGMTDWLPPPRTLRLDCAPFRSYPDY
jgi:hypothetical protein